jgi:hypothetical protein
MNLSISEIVSSLESYRSSNGERLRVLVIGSREGITETIQQFHVLRYAEVAAWSPILPVPNFDEVMSILTKYRSQLS